MGAAPFLVIPGTTFLTLFMHFGSLFDLEVQLFAPLQVTFLEEHWHKI